MGLGDPERRHKHTCVYCDLTHCVRRALASHVHGRFCQKDARCSETGVLVSELAPGIWSRRVLLRKAGDLVARRADRCRETGDLFGRRCDGGRFCQKDARCREAGVLVAKVNATCQVLKPGIWSRQVPKPGIWSRREAGDLVALW